MDMAFSTALLILASAAAQPIANPETAPALPPELAAALNDPGFATAQDALRRDHDRLVQQIIELTQIPAPPFGEQARGKAYAELMKQSGLADVAMDAIGNVIGVRPGEDRSLPPLIVAAHLDTVFPAKTDLKVRREGTRLLAPGIGDDTRGLAVLMAMARAMNSAGLRTKRDIMFVGNVGEEGPGDLRGMHYLFEHNPRAREAFAFISVDSNGATAITTRGVGSHRYHIVFSGPGGHSYDKFGTVNPLVALAKTVEGLYRIPVPTVPKTTYSASVVGGGTSVNTIPPEVFLDVDMRSVSEEEVARVDKALRDIAQKAVDEENALRSTEFGKITVTFNTIGMRPAGQTDETKGLGAVAYAASQAFGYKPQFAANSTDANVPMSLGIPAIAIGSGGRGGGEHTPHEWIDVEINESVRGISVDLATVLAMAGGH
ncbi:M20/M25/M40 family metallo-hydrolase [Novosphingobium sp. 1949]|uniref:M20/M25/M40 family metallo-hydrolase n=1 Tax=Novosphingobium organovorum TaxID=2930092 RepID=A0ABT0BBM1_9SPHN|nr:M20/M25/M40 family metallo-hydrolase [Novosphingobium organovorum]MCJ2182457.1 M20/M25/M40 family metallo-hydrolase [Novosphingobium organovorum]